MDKAPYKSCNFYMRSKTWHDVKAIVFFFQVAERALFLWNNDHIVSLIAPNRDAILPIVFPALERNIKSHWNQSVLNVTLNVRKIFSEMDEELFSSCQRKFEEEEEQHATIEDKRRTIWIQLESAASVQPMSGNTPVLVASAAAPMTC